MSILFTEGFDWATTPSEIFDGTNWEAQNPGLFNITAGRLSGNAIRLPNSSAVATRGLGVSPTDYILGFAINRTSGVTGVTFNNTEKGTLFFVGFSETGNVQILDSRDLTAVTVVVDQLIAQSVDNFPTESWNYMEIRVVNAGTIEVYMNGALAVGGTVIRGAAPPDQIAFNENGGNSNVGNYQIDDLYFKVGGGAYNSSTLPLGDARIVTMFPEVDATTDGTPSVGVDNFAVVADNTDTTFSDLTGVNDVNLFGTTTPFPFNPQQIYSVQVAARYAKTNASLRRAEIIQQGFLGTIVSSPPRVMTLDPATDYFVFEREPENNDEFTKNIVEALNFGLRVDL